MQLPHWAFFYSLSLTAAGVLSSPPIHSSTLRPLHSRQALNCLNFGAPFDGKCWKELDVDDWLRDWDQTNRCPGVVSNGSTTDVAVNDGSRCCQSTEAWSTCFLRLTLGRPGYNCTAINPQRCPFELTPAVTNSTSAPRIKYVLEAIFTLNNLFTTYFTALQYAVLGTDQVITSMVNAIDKLKSEAPILNLLSALTAGLAILGAPGIGAKLVGSAVQAPLSAALKNTAQAAIISLQQAPGIVKALWPTGTLASRLIQIGQINTQLKDTNTILTARFVAALEMVMTDVPTFIQFAGTGQWSSGQSLSIPDRTTDLSRALHNYVLSELLSRNKWSGRIQPDTLANASKYPTLDSLETGNFNSGVDCDPATNICTSKLGTTPFFWSPATYRVFSLISPDFPDYDRRAEKMMKDIVTNDWGDLEILFDGAFNCTFQGRRGQDVIGLGPGGLLDWSCLSQLPISSPRQGCHPGSFLVNGKDCPFPNLTGS